MSKRHFFSASEIFSTSTVPAQQGMPAFCNLKVSKKSSVDPKAIGGCGLYFFLHHGHLVYIGKFLGTIHDAFGGNIFSARWNRHISTLSLRGSRISMSQANLARATEQGLPVGLSGSMQGADEVKLAKDRGFMVPYKRLHYAALHWSEFSGSAESWLPNIEVGYLQLDPAACSRLSISDVRKKVSTAEERAIAQVPTVLNGPGEFDAALVKKFSKDEVFDLLESMFDAPSSTEHVNTEQRQTQDIGADLESDFYGERFLESLPGECPEDTVTAIYETFANLTEAEVHHTKTEGGDLRIRALNTPRKRNIFTMYWQPKNQLFFCRIFLAPENVDGAGVVEVRPSPKYEPLRTTFKLDCSQPEAIENLLKLINRSLAYACAHSGEGDQ